MPQSLTGPEERAVVHLVREAGDLALDYFGSDRVAIRAKGPRDVVTAADTAAESLIRDRLREIFPGDSVVGEEGTAVSGTSGRAWYVDPIDGTLNFSRGIPIWCVSLALFEEGRPVYGAIRDPVRGETFHTNRRQAWCNGLLLSARDPIALEDALVHVTVDFADESRQQGLADLLRVAPRVLRTRNIGSAALALAYVAAGRLDAFLHRYAHPWDYGGGVALIHAMGGGVEAMDGGEYTVETHSVVAAATPDLERALRRLLADPPPLE